MKKMKIQSRYRLPATLLAGCVAAAVGMSVSVKAEHHELKVVEGRLVPLFQALSGDDTSRMQQQQRDQQRLGTSPGVQSPSRSLPGQPTDYTDELRPGTGTGTGTGTGIERQPGTGTGIGTQPGTGTGIGTQPGTGTGIGTQPGIGAQPGLGTQAGMGAMQMTGPLALIAESRPQAVQDAQTQTELPEGRQSTPDRTRTSPTLGERVQGLLGGSGEGDIYVLVFDPANPQAQSAYQRAQSIAQGGAMHGMRQQWDTEQTERQLGQTQGLGQDLDRERVRDQQRQTQYGAGQEQTVRVTGRIIERDGLQAIAVHSVEPKMDAHRGHQQTERDLR
jgi:hypothetical protein